jgi:hypothetical protein
MPDYDDHSGLLPPGTLRDHGWPSLRQFSVFLENRVGKLHELLRHVERYDLRVIGLSVIDSVDFAITRLILHDVDRAREVLALSHFATLETDILGVMLPDSPQPFLEIFLTLMAAELNIHYAYPLVFRREGRGAIALHVENIEQATAVLRAKGHAIVTEDDLLDS